MHDLYTINVWNGNKLFFSVDKDDRADAIHVGTVLRNRLRLDMMTVSILKWTSVGPSDLQRERVDF